MDNTYDKGIAFICEGDTEKQFYLSLLNYFCDKYNASIQKILNQQEIDIVYELARNGGQNVTKSLCEKSGLRILSYRKSWRWSQTMPPSRPSFRC